MTVGEARRRGETILRDAGLEDTRFQADCLLAAVLQCTHTQLLLQTQQEVDTAQERRFFALTDRLCAGEPLQYLLGEWDFLGLTLAVGEGVLIPRPETEQLALLAIDALKEKPNPMVLDLCAGSGCIALAIAAARPDARVYALEYSAQAFAYLEKNIRRCALPNVTAVRGDVLAGFALSGLPRADVIVSNPPYIRTAEIAFLQAQVQKEPHMALDGGADGYRFYRALAEQWTDALLPDGTIAMECGEGQAAEIIRLFAEKGIKAQSVLDSYGVERMVTNYIDGGVILQ